MNQGFVPQPNRNHQPPQGWVSPAANQQALIQNQPPQQPGGQQAYYASLPQQNMQPPRAKQGYAPPHKRPPRKPHKPVNPVKIAMMIALIILLIAGGILGVSTLRDNQVRKFIEPYQKVYAPNVLINDMPIGGMTPQDAFTLIRSKMEERINSWNLAISYRGFTFANLNYGVLGITVSDQEIQQLLNEAWLATHKGSIHDQKAAIESVANKPLKLYTSQKELQSTHLVDIFTQIAPYVNAKPVDAAIAEFRPDEPNPFVFIDEQAGAVLDSQAAMDQIMEMAASGQSGTYELQPSLIPPKVTRAELENTVALLTTIQTPVETSKKDSANRIHNIRLSFSKFNGKILKPGQTFSFNNIVGPRTEQAGFAEAPEYAYGNLVDGIGGGVCQASTTLYQAAVTSGLSIVKRYPHSGKIGYTDMGQDATVYLTKDRNIDFQFKNTSAGDIYITAHVKQARTSSKKLVAEIKMYGIGLGDGISYRLRSETVKTIPPPEEKKYETDSTGIYATYTDEEKLKTKAVEGYVVETYLEKIQNGVLIEPPKLLSSDTFPPKPAVYYRGVNKRNP
ncbi:MAG: hypothetical protein GXZ04_05710 [Clostridiales bacterium]|nr:hypothetical protein [Clostridiales bacterium]